MFIEPNKMMHQLKLSLIFAIFIAISSPILPCYSADADSSTNFIALIIGNSKYTDSFLPGPENDATDIATVLKNSGFTISNPQKMTNLNHSEMTLVVETFISKVEKGSFAVIYYSGHGLEDDNKNYLVPTDATLQKEDLNSELISLDWILKRLDQREARTKIIILDACRNMPSALKYKQFLQDEGLAELKILGPGTRVIYAASPRQKAVAAGAGERNSVFTAALLEAFKEKLNTFDEVLNKAAQLTLKKTGNKQVPWSAGVIGMSFNVAPQVSVIKTDPSTNKSISKYEENNKNDETNCTIVSQVKIENGISTWSKKCI